MLELTAQQEAIAARMVEIMRDTEDRMSHNQAVRRLQILARAEWASLRDVAELKLYNMPRSVKTLKQHFTHKKMVDGKLCVPGYDLAMYAKKKGLLG